MVGLITFLLFLWFVCGFVAAGLERAYFEERFKILGSEYARDSFLERVCFILGPLALFGAVMNCRRASCFPCLYGEKMPPNFFPYGWTNPLAPNKYGLDGDKLDNG